jgi:IS30 family transposase
VADYAFRTLEDRQKIEKLWDDGRTPKEISVRTGKSLPVIYAELTRGRDGTRLPDQRLRYSAELAQRRVQESLEKRGKRNRRPAASRQAVKQPRARR